MAFHVACPITCQRICFCTLGFQGNLLSTNQRNKFVEEVSKIEEFIRDPLLFRLGGEKTLQISVPRIPAAANATVDSVDDGEELLSIQNKRAAMQKDAIAASMIAEDYARRFESGNLDVISGEAVCEITGEDQVSLTKVMCRMCFSGENEGSERAAKMLPCKVCGKKYHRNCVKSWAEHRDLFHWNSWSCPSCRICEVCRRAGDPNKFMYCKRCDAAYHCYCQQPPHKNVSSGPYLCPKHTRCHSCGSTVSGCGLSTRWFLSYTCCDACGRLFTKGKYCPICLKVYRDSESTPMVCCDSCQRWVHCDCDGIGDEKYQQFQINRNLYYKCAACRGDCYQVRGLDDAVQELWRRRDEADQDLIASLRASAGLLSYEEIPSVSPYSDDEDGPIISRSDQSKSLKFSVKGLVTKSTKNSKESGKKSSSKKYPKKKEHQLNESVMEEKKSDETLYTHNWPSDKEKSAVVEEVAVNHKDRPPNILHVKTKAHSVDMGGSTGYHAKVETVKGTKLVIHLGSRSKNVMSSPKSEASSCLKEQDLVASNGSEGTSHQRPHDRKGSSDEQKDVAVAVADKTSRTGQEKNIIKLGKIKTEITDSNIQDGRRNSQHVYEFLSHENTVKKQKLEANSTPIDSSDENAARNEELSKHKGIMKKVCKENLDSLRFSSVSKSLPKDSKPLLKLKFKNPYFDSQSSWTSSHGEEEKNLVKGQRSKRKRPSYLTEKMSDKNDETDELSPHDNLVKEAMDANWILKRLGKDAIGKRVELHDSSDNTWYRGVVTDAIKGSSSLAVYLDDGRFKTLDLGKQSVRFTSQKHKRTKK